MGFREILHLSARQKQACSPTPFQPQPRAPLTPCTLRCCRDRSYHHPRRLCRRVDLHPRPRCRQVHPSRPVESVAEEVLWGGRGAVVPGSRQIPSELGAVSVARPCHTRTPTSSPGPLPTCLRPVRRFPFCVYRTTTTTITHHHHHPTLPHLHPYTHTHLQPHTHHHPPHTHPHPHPHTHLHPYTYT